MNSRDVYRRSAVLLESANNEFLTKGGGHNELLGLKLMASIIHNDICREIHNLKINPTTGVSKVLSVGPTILKLLEAHFWYSHIGNKKLRELAESRGMLEVINHKLIEMKLLRPSRIEKYSKLRDKIAAHYDVQSIDMLHELEQIKNEEFFEDVEMMVRYHQEWLWAIMFINQMETPGSAP